MNLDLSFARAAVVLPKDFDKVKFFLIGAGGTGSFAAMNLARLMFELQRSGKAAEMTVIDADTVENGNIPRSNFCNAEIGKFKAQTLAERIALAWGLEVFYTNENLEYEKHIKPHGTGFGDLTILVGCVDNHHARREIGRSLAELNKYNAYNAPSAWWIDGGNGKYAGQVLIGSEVEKTNTADFLRPKEFAKNCPRRRACIPNCSKMRKFPPDAQIRRG